MFNFLTRIGEVHLPADFNETQFTPMTELEHFASATRKIITGLDNNIVMLEDEIQTRLAKLRDFKRIKTSQEIALRHMEDE